MYEDRRVQPINPAIARVPIYTALAGLAVSFLFEVPFGYSTSEVELWMTSGDHVQY